MLPSQGGDGGSNPLGDTKGGKMLKVEDCSHVSYQVIDFKEVDGIEILKFKCTDCPYEWWENE